MLNQPEWSTNAVLYEVNIRQYTREGTFKAFRKHIPRLKKLGVKILWFMPIHPIGEKKRKGSLGSYYSIKDFTGINVEFGTVQEFKEMVEEIHHAGMYVLIDWVANHTSWDNHLVYEHPEWYVRDKNGNIQSPFDWDDAADLDFSSNSLRKYMIECMRFWVKNCDVDGFRCDVAEFVPDDFWNQARIELMEEKHVFLMAEAERPEHHYDAFDMCYASRMHRLMNEVARGHKKACDIRELYQRMKYEFPADTWFMQFISNHDENSWKGSEFERLGEPVNLFINLIFTLPDMPLIYSGQEIGMKQQLEFFEKDEIVWKESEYENYYIALIQLKKHHKALWNGRYGGEVSWIYTNHNDEVLAFVREKEGHGILVILNFSDKQMNVILKDESHAGQYKEFYSGIEKSFKGFDSVIMLPYECCLFYNTKGLPNPLF